MRSNLQVPTQRHVHARFHNDSVVLGVVVAAIAGGRPAPLDYDTVALG
jgi:hypothetical protein